MNRKTLIFMMLALLVGIGVGTGGTIWAERSIFKSQSVSSASRSKIEGPLVPIGDFTVNLQGGSFLKSTITVVGTDSSADALLKANEAYLKDRVNTVLANKALSDVQTPAAREKLRKELIDQLNEVAENRVANVLFLTLVYQ